MPAYLRHVVLLAFKASTSKATIQTIEEAFVKLNATISEVTDLEYGANVSPENHSQGFTHCFLLSFRREADRDAYLVHPDHKAFGNLLRPALEKICVVDYWS